MHKARSECFISLLCSVRSKAYTQVFAKGEDSLSLRLTSKLVDLRSGNANWISRSARKRSSNNDSSSRQPHVSLAEALRKCSIKSQSPDTRRSIGVVWSCYPYLNCEEPGGLFKISRKRTELIRF